MTNPNAERSAPNSESVMLYLKLLSLTLPVLMLGACALATAAELRELPSVSELPARPEFPDPLRMLDGREVTSKRQWERERRPELKRLFQHYMYGYFPETAGKIRAKVAREQAGAFGGKATLREVTVSYGPAGTPPLHLLLFTPTAGKGPAPCFLGLNFCGNHAVTAEPGVRVPDVWMYPSQPGAVNNRATEAGRGKQAELWNVEQTIDRGYAFATFYSGDVDPDRNDFSDGIHPHYRQTGEEGRGPHGWGTLAAWAWGFQRAVDYLRTDRRIDAKRIAVVGHSRNGKASLLAAAFDERIALAIPHQAGCGGTAPSRSTVGESVTRINTSFPHWFDDTFKEFNDRPERLPFDQHCLVALMAPRPVLLSNAEEDTWANPKGQFEMLRAAEPVYRLLGRPGSTHLGAREMPASGKLLDSRLGYFIRPGRHSMTREDWQAFLAYADRHLRAD